ncbi:HesA/MoeB/ThiF family protein [Zooshikella ganghwensis]|uniref:Molybdopterin-synthase adenylyltransferase n=1 Tax=Zooshikella ganghwensis TaxID=202772 RepID=A0A4P9VQ75_9GAMM|nr:molybdopterin-synthase adenylyltransferase MoeB [Zooshikella ganghwensis]RDH45653.1 molybdopterin-synthase adenylyltransferase MoeB [Zooshikella ganghwensis]
MLSDEELLRYSRQIMLPEVDIQGQEALAKSRVAIIGLGGLGSPVSMYLAAAGVGELVLVDFDQVDLSNLQRQIVHTSDSIGVDKVLSASKALKQLNPTTHIFTIKSKFTQAQLPDEILQADVIVDATDNFNTRYVLNRFCVRHKKPLVSGAAIGLSGQVTVFDSRQPNSPCYHCLYPEGHEEQPMTCSESGVLASVVGMIGTVQATEVIKLLVGFGTSLVGRLLVLDAKYMEWRSLKLAKNAQCQVCADQKS